MVKHKRYNKDFKLQAAHLYEADILKSIDLGKQHGWCPHQIVVFGIVPEFVINWAWFNSG